MATTLGPAAGPVNAAKMLPPQILSVLPSTSKPSRLPTQDVRIRPAVHCDLLTYIQKSHW